VFDFTKLKNSGKQVEKIIRKKEQTWQVAADKHSGEWLI
jgi:hypothetical protein